MTYLRIGGPFGNFMYQKESYPNAHVGERPKKQCKTRLPVDVYVSRVRVACAAFNRECVPLAKFSKLVKSILFV